MADLSQHSIRQTVGAFERVILMHPAWDKRHGDPAKNFGVHGVDMSFAVIRAGTAVDFLLMTGWHLPHVREEPGRARPSALPAAVQYHAPAPWAEYLDSPTSDSCGFTGGVCFSDSSGLDALTVFDLLCTDGLAAIWRELEQRWVSQFGARYA